MATELKNALYFGTNISPKAYSSSSSPRLVSVLLCRAHSRAVVFHTLHKGKRDTIICTYLV